MRKQPSHSTDKAALFLIDHDGSVGEFLCSRPGEDIFSSIANVINLPVEEISQAVVACASLRQSWHSDMLGMLMNVKSKGGGVTFNGSIMYGLSTAKQQLHTLLGDKPVSIEPFLLGDLGKNFKEENEGFSYQLIDKFHKWEGTLNALEKMLCEKLNNNKENLFSFLSKRCSDFTDRQQQIENVWSMFLGKKDHFIDDSKFLSLLTQIHLTAKNLVNKQIVVVFIDDIRQYAAQLHNIFSRNTWLLPANVEFRSVHYSYNSYTKKTSPPTWLDNLTVQGTGRICGAILRCAKQWACAHSHESSVHAYQENRTGFLDFFTSWGFADVALTPIRYTSCLPSILEGEAVQHSNNATATLTGQSGLFPSPGKIKSKTLPAVKPQQSIMAITTPNNESSMLNSPRVTQKKTILLPINTTPRC